MYRRFLISLAFVTSASVFVSFMLLKWFRYKTYLGDFEIFWVAGSAWPALYREIHDLPFAYPPTALLLLRPLGLLPFWWALALWTIGGSTSLYLMARRLVGGRSATLGLLTASSLWLILEGQMSIVLTPLLIGGVLTRRPWLVGLCFAAVGVVKPQAALAVPVALLASRNYRAIGWGVLFALAIIALSMSIWGVALWVRWFEILDEFQQLLTARGLDMAGAGIAGFAAKVGLPSWLFLLGVPLGLLCVWLTFSREAADVDRFAALSCGTVLLSPYVLGYDLAGLSIVSTVFLLDKGRSLNMWRASAMIVSFVLTAPGVVLMAICLLRPSASTSNEQTYLKRGRDLAG